MDEPSCSVQRDDAGKSRRVQEGPQKEKGACISDRFRSYPHWDMEASERSFKIDVNSEDKTYYFSKSGAAVASGSVKTGILNI